MEVEYHNSDSVHPPAGMYSHIAMPNSNNLVFLAGQVSLDKKGSLVGPNDVGLQTNQIYENIGNLLTEAGSNYHNIVQLTTYLVGRNSVKPYLESRAVIFDKIFKPKQQPPNTLLIIDGLLEEDMLVEITTVAVV